MDKTTKWLIRVMAIVVIAAVGGGIYVVSEEKAKEAKIQRKKDCKSDPMYVAKAYLARQAMELEYMQETYRLSKKAGQTSARQYAREADDYYEKCINKK